MTYNLQNLLYITYCITRVKGTSSKINCIIMSNMYFIIFLKNDVRLLLGISAETILKLLIIY